MSAQSYKIIIGFDDSQMQKLSKQFGGTFGTSKGGAAGGMGGNTALFKNLTKLGLIATASIGTLKGIEKLVSLTVNSSPMLGAMLKILSTAVTFILRPIGDFIGFFLRPMIVYFLRTIALPIYKEWGPIMRNLGAVLGADFFKPIESALTFLTTEISVRQQILDAEHTAVVTRNRDAMLDFKAALQSVGDDLRSGSISLDFTQLINRLSAQITGALTGLGAGILGTLDFSGINSSTKLWSDNFTKNITDIDNAFTTGFDSFISFFSNLETNLSVLHTGVILPGVAAIGEFFTTMTASITDIISTTWDAITQFFQQIIEFFTTIPQQIMGSIFPQVGTQQSVVSGQADPIGINVNFYDTIFEGATEGLENAASQISNILNSALNGNR